MNQPITVKLHMTGHFSMRHIFRIFLKLQGLKVNAVALVGHDMIRIDGASLQLSGLITKQNY